MIEKLLNSPRLFKWISWGLTALIVVSLLGVTIWKVYPTAALAAVEPAPTQGPVSLSVTAPVASKSVDQAIVRLVTLKTDISSNTSFDTLDYTVQPGDSVFSIAKDHNIKPETVLWANEDILQGSPDSLRVGQVLKIPPVDGVYYQWKDGDTLQAIADKFSATVDDILNFPGNNIDLTDPTIQPGAYVMVQNGKSDYVQWVIPTIARGRSGTASVGQAACGNGPVGSGVPFNWPADAHYLSGNDYSPSHLGIDIAAGEGANIYAADAGVVTLALKDGSWNHGYGNVIMIDHGNGYVTLYAHLSAVFVNTCQGVGRGQLIGLAGATGNAFGAHLHFEVRYGGGFVNPWYELGK